MHSMSAAKIIGKAKENTQSETAVAAIASCQPVGTGGGFPPHSHVAKAGRHAACFPNAMRNQIALIVARTSVIAIFR